MNRYPLWIYLLVGVVLITGIIYALPNLYPSDPAIQISASKNAPVDQTLNARVEAALKKAGVDAKELEMGDEQLLVRFDNTDNQLKASEFIRAELKDDYISALNLAQTTPGWLRALNAKPMFLGLDLRGGVHFLMEVDMKTAKDKALDRYTEQFRDDLREAKVTYLGVAREGDNIIVKFKQPEERAAAEKVLRDKYRFEQLLYDHLDDTTPGLIVGMSEQALRDIEKFALQQNITTLRNRVNELGVAEPIIQQQGTNRIVVQLPGVQDTARAKEILGATATLEFRMVAEGEDPESALRRGRPPVGTKLYTDRSLGNGQEAPILLKRRVITTGDHVTGADATFDQNNQPAVSINLDASGAKRMLRNTTKNVKKLMAVVFIETKFDEIEVDGKITRKPRNEEYVINVARIQEAFGSRFQITGLDSTKESTNLALLLRAGALAAPLYIVEERTVGPNLGQENIDSGFKSIVIGFILVLIFMAVYYRVFGLVANLALAMNVVLMFAALSIMQATLTLPGIAGIVLTIGMAVDANVLIFERIKEELRRGTAIQTAIKQGYEQAFSTIADANITTLIAAVVLFGFGTGPIKGFAITLAIGIVSSMFTAIIGSRALINWIYGGKRVQKLHI